MPDQRERIVFKARLEDGDGRHLTDEQWLALIAVVDSRPWLFALPAGGPGPARVMLPGAAHTLRVDPDGSRYREAFEEDPDA